MSDLELREYHRKQSMMFAKGLLIGFTVLCVGAWLSNNPTTVTTALNWVTELFS